MRTTSAQWAFLRDERGASAVEFAMVCPIFLAVVGAALQMMLMFLVSQNLDTGLQSTVRTLVTGQFQSENSANKDKTALIGKLRKQLCNNTGVAAAAFFNCNDVILDVQVVDTFAGVTGANGSALDPSTGNWRAGFGTAYTCPQPSKIVVVRAALKYAVFFSMMNAGIKSFGDGSALIQSNAVFRVEPYQSDSSSAC
ncbi:TadE/TadG family type IV pilus assembly protein [Methylobacterium goesingense]|uniref:Flp pilus assembly protein TadG n=1 Tax=Methylobacterium goesingense TaxID=243690 RepID=A0ABV2LDW1_9HYPH|nr:TadE/TadG family type IV pilus assembly protein [Methylobacterium goesingense]GJD74059.1 hypothetical protein CFIICLFH_2292 [Methylobacterium goesingense]